MLLLATALLAGVATAMPLVKRDSTLMGTIGGKKKLAFDGNGNFKVGSQETRTCKLIKSRSSRSAICISASDGVCGLLSPSGDLD